MRHTAVGSDAAARAPRRHERALILWTLWWWLLWKRTFWERIRAGALRHHDWDRATRRRRGRGRVLTSCKSKFEFILKRASVVEARGGYFRSHGRRSGMRPPVRDGAGPPRNARSVINKGGARPCARAPSCTRPLPSGRWLPPLPPQPLYITILRTRRRPYALALGPNARRIVRPARYRNVNVERWLWRSIDPHVYLFR